MAKAQRGGMAAIVGLVIFAILWVLSLIFAILFRVHLRDATVAAEDARKALAVYVRPSEVNDSRIIEVKAKIDEEGNGASVVFGLLAENDLLKRIINNKPDSSVRAIRNEMSTLGIPEGRDLVAEISRLHAEDRADKQDIDQLRLDLKTAQDGVVKLEQEKSELSRKFQQDVESLKTQVVAIQGEYDDFRGVVRKDMSDLETRIKQIQNEGQQQVNEYRSQLDQKDDQMAALKKRIKDLELQLTVRGGETVDIRTMPDGQVASILSEENLVYIDRGERDHIRLGMTFQVYDKDELIKLDAQLQELRGKATIEVISMAEHAAVARIVRLDEGKVVNEGDQIANVVYDPEATFKFFVYGEFDIDNTGTPTDTDRRRIETMVTQWNGKLANMADADQGRSLSYDVDYLVLGIEPELPDPLPPDTIDPELIAIHTAKTRKFERYQSLIKEAKELSIPVLNQNRFLGLVGYYQR